jgi:hypothetical protein
MFKRIINPGIDGLYNLVARAVDNYNLYFEIKALDHYGNTVFVPMSVDCDLDKGTITLSKSWLSFENDYVVYLKNMIKANMHRYFAEVGAEVAEEVLEMVNDDVPEKTVGNIFSFDVDTLIECNLLNLPGKIAKRTALPCESEEAKKRNNLSHDECMRKILDEFPPERRVFRFITLGTVKIDYYCFLYEKCVIIEPVDFGHATLIMERGESESTWRNCDARVLQYSLSQETWFENLKNKGLREIARNKSAVRRALHRGGENLESWTNSLRDGVRAMQKVSALQE